MNGVDIKLYNNGKLNVMDAIISFGMSNTDIFPKRGSDLKFTFNGEERTVRGTNGDSSIIKVNYEDASVNTPIKCNDIITVRESTVGEKGSIKIADIPEYKQDIYFIINGKQSGFERKIFVNGNPAGKDYEVCEGDEVEIRDYYTAEELFDSLKLSDKFRVTINNRIINPAAYDRSEKIYGNYIIDIESADESIKGIVKDARDVVELVSEDGESVVDDRKIREDEDYEAYLDRRYGKNQYRSIKHASEEKDEGLGSFAHLSGDEINMILAADRMETALKYKELQERSDELNRELEKLRKAAARKNTVSESTVSDDTDTRTDRSPENKELTEDSKEAEPVKLPRSPREIIISVNGTPIHMTGKGEYTFVDILDFYPFDTSSLKGNTIVQTCNGKRADFFTPIDDGDVVELYWA